MSESGNAQRDIGAEFKALRLHGMASAWADLMEQGGSAELTASRWLVEQLLQAEEVNRHMRSIAHQTKVARFPLHRDLAGFDFEVFLRIMFRTERIRGADLRAIQRLLQ